MNLNDFCVILQASATGLRETAGLAASFLAHPAASFISQYSEAGILLHPPVLDYAFPHLSIILKNATDE